MTSSMPWVKLYTEMLDDPKIGRLCDAVKWRFVSLVLLAGECDQDGALISGSDPMSVTDIAWRLRITRDQCETELEELTKCGVLDDDAGVYFLPKFSERQGRPQSEKREAWRVRKAKQRESQKSQDNVTGESRVIHASRVEESRVEESREEESNAATPLPRSVQAYIDCGGGWQPGKLRDGTSKKDNCFRVISETVKDDDESIALWRRVVSAYCAQWSSKSYTVMLNDYYLQGRVPGESRNGNGNGTHAARVVDAIESTGNPMLDAIAKAQKDPNYGKQRSD